MKRQGTILFAAVAVAGLIMARPVVGANYAPVFDAADFVSGFTNPYLPLVPGTTFLYEGETEDGMETNEVFVTHDTKEILGVATTVVRDTVWVDGVLAELTFDWYAQNVSGDIWYFGEDSTEYDEDGNAVNDGSWEAGVDGAEAGVLLAGNPAPGLTYLQEYYEDVAEDTARVVRLNADASVVLGDYENTLVTKEWNPLEPGEVEFKYYAMDVGMVLIREVSGGPTVRVELAEITNGQIAAGHVLPEPATMSLLGLGALALVRRKRE